MRLTYRATYTVRLQPGSQGRRHAIAGLWAILALLAAGGAFAIWRNHVQDEARAQRYSSDPGCRFPTDASVSSKGICTEDDAIVVAHYLHTYRGSRYYRFAIRTPDGQVDSVEAKDANARTIWNATPLGATVRVQRIATEDSRPHITLLSSGMLVERTEWHPTWRTTNTLVGVWLLGMASVSCLVVSLRRAVGR